MLFPVIIGLLALVPLCYGQYGSGNMVATSTPVISSTMTSGACQPNNDTAYKALVQSQANLYAELFTVLAANSNAQTDNSSGFFLGQIVLTYQNIQLLNNTQNPVNGTLCLSANTQIANTINQQIVHKDDPVPQPLTGENYYQDLLQRLGQSFYAFDQVKAACAGVDGGPWLTILQNRNTALGEIITAINNNDSSASCLKASSDFATALQPILQAKTTY